MHGCEQCSKMGETFSRRNTRIQDQPERNKETVDEIIQDDRRVTVDTIARTPGLGHNAVQELIESLVTRTENFHLFMVVNDGFTNLLKTDYQN